MVAEASPRLRTGFWRTSTRGRVEIAQRAIGSSARASKLESGPPVYRWRPWAVLFDATTQEALTSPFALSTSHADALDLAFDGHQYRVVWRDGTQTGTLHEVRLTTDGQPAGAEQTLGSVGPAWPGLTITPSTDGLLYAHSPLVEAQGAVRIELKHFVDGASQ